MEAPGVHTRDGGETDEPPHMTREVIDERIATKEAKRGQLPIVARYQLFGLRGAIRAPHCLVS